MERVFGRASEEIHMYKTVFLIFSIFAVPAIAVGASPYAGQELRFVKSLSDAEIASLRSGDGMGFAKLAELNHFPGPKHVLELSNELELSETQLAETKMLFEQMRQSAVSIGEQLIAAESRLDQDFAKGSVSAESLRASLAEIQRLRTELRYVHLEAHLRQTELLSKDQIRHYDAIRGYHDGSKLHHEHDKHGDASKEPRQE